MRAYANERAGLALFAERAPFPLLNFCRPLSASWTMIIRYLPVVIERALFVVVIVFKKINFANEPRSNKRVAGELMARQE